LSPIVLTRALEPFPLPVPTLDALHLATADYLRKAGSPAGLATYDERMRDVAARLKFPLYDV